MFKVIRVDGVGRVSPLHRNMRLLFSCLPREGNTVEYDTVEDDSDGISDPEDLTSVADEVDQNNSSSDSYRIEEIEYKKPWTGRWAT